jgi:hypothetical protein
LRTGTQRKNFFPRRSGMKYYSDILKKTFDTEKACLEAEKAHTDELALAEK